ncbi:type II toxin-antitoxin system RelE/ParE family toxin [Psychromarinibacter sp. C21-152]|uniref:Type II toxin-antitoxin system RelE/ParE family toxin n=1 Tax=Psychromarinibacter sediminicola TaxID=3033385 RepID=A0AAE3NS95_9RHOB|nr:type II toxin-antitoxin system RelE/ParE family toxin [Psychromarinibacter sediminicola]MDF0602593.1 type II toxin-antitoxin system RelE/ParE family toxin [Psychromarinibacter sediminicola]
MNRPWRLTRLAERSLGEIAAWTFARFGPRQAAAYEADLIECCDGIAAGTAVGRDCSLLVGGAGASDLRYVRAGMHFVVYLERESDVVVIDVLHARSDLPRRLAALAAARRG